MYEMVSLFNYSPIHVDIKPIEPLGTQVAAAQEVSRPAPGRRLAGFHEPAVAEVHALPHAATAGHVRDDARVAL